MRTLSAVGASLSPHDLDEFDRVHTAMLREHANPLTVLFRHFAAIAVKG